MHWCHFIDILLRKYGKIPFKTAQKWEQVFLIHHFDAWFEPVNESPIICCLGLFLRDIWRVFKIFFHGYLWCEVQVVGNWDEKLYWQKICQIFHLPWIHFIYTDLLYCWNALIGAISKSICGSTLTQLWAKICYKCGLTLKDKMGFCKITQKRSEIKPSC